MSGSHVTAGETGVSYVADSGAELFHHTYSVILRCATGTDSITFSYIIREEEGDHYTCHVFQCLTPADVSSLHSLSLHFSKETSALSERKMHSL